MMVTSEIRRMAYAASLFLCGCFGTHGVDPEPPVPDAGMGGPIMVDPPIFTGICGGSLEPTGAPRPTLAIFEHGDMLVAGEDLRFSLLVPGCHCGVTPVCETRYDSARGRIDVTTELCAHPDAFGCESCGQSDYGAGRMVDCMVATATLRHDVGNLDVYVNGAVGLHLGDGILRTPEPRPERGFAAIELGPVIGRELICEWPGQLDREQETCFIDAMSAGQSTQIFVRDPCPGCFDAAGPCEVRVSVEDRTIEVNTHRRTCLCAGCAVCDLACVPRSRSCRTPVLRVPGAYRVAVNGMEHGSLTVVDGPVERPSVNCEEQLGSDASEGSTAAPRSPG